MLKSLPVATIATLSRPTTATVMKMIHRLVPSSYAKNKKKTRAKDIQKLIDKVNRNQRKTVDIHKAFVTALGEWGVDLPTEELRHMIAVFSTLLDAISVSVLEECERLASLKVSLGAISQREERQKFLIEKHDTLQSKLEVTALKNGPQASQTMLCVDEIEENEYNLKLIEQQLARTATSNLKDVCGEFLRGVRGTKEALLRAAAELSRSVESELKDSELPGNVDSELPVDSELRSPKFSEYKPEYRLDADRFEDKFSPQKSPDQKKDETLVFSPALPHDPMDLPKFLPRRINMADYDIRNFEGNHEGWGNFKY